MRPATLSLGKAGAYHDVIQSSSNNVDQNVKNGDLYCITVTPAYHAAMLLRT